MAHCMHLLRFPCEDPKAKRWPSPGQGRQEKGHRAHPSHPSTTLMGESGEAVKDSCAPMWHKARKTGLRGGVGNRLLGCSACSVCRSPSW